MRLGVREHFNIPKLHFMLHYVEAICSRGSCDGFNTELPERLHIDYAKQAYHASNRRNYLEQMVTWLARQEVVDLHASYVHWYHKHPVTEQCNLTEPSDEDWVDEPDPTEDSSERPLARNDERISGSVVSGLSYSLAKYCPFPGMPLECIEREYGATEFLPALAAFIHANLPTCQLKPNRMDCYDVYKGIRITYRTPPHSDTRWQQDQIHTVLGRSSRGTKPGVAAHFDTAFIQDLDAPIDEQDDPHSVSSEFPNCDRLPYACTHLQRSQGTHVARVRVIFDLPPQFGPFPHPLAYVEWFTPLRNKRPDLKVGLYQVAPSTQQWRPNAAIVSRI